MPRRFAALLGRLSAQFGDDSVLVGAEIPTRYHADWTDVNRHPPLAVLRPRSTEEVAECVSQCARAGQQIVVQGGLTGLAGGATPRAGEIALTLERLVGVEAIDARDGTLRVRAGTPLQVVQEAASEQRLQFALDLGSRGTCTIGGNIATNAGGNRVIRYGMMRELVLGVEAVLADGTIVSSMNSMLKNNAGYDLKQLFIGSEGTLGVVTRAVLRLHPAPLERITALVAAPSFAGVSSALQQARSALGAALVAFEVMWSDYFGFASSEVLQGASPFARPHPFYFLIEVETLDPLAEHDRLTSLLSGLVEAGDGSDAIVARSLEQSARLWSVREGAGQLLQRLAPATAYDISLPIHRMEAYVEEVARDARPLLAGHPLYFFGHLGDGNLHILAALRSAADVEQLDEVVYGALAGFGSISAEHGIGVLKRRHLGNSRTPAELALMKRLKVSLDPKNILNPGRVV